MQTLKIILSRKGLDSGVSDLSNLLLTDKNGNSNLIMIPIPDCEEKYTYNDLKFSKNQKILDAVKQYLGKSKKINLHSKCHVDPNLINYFDDKEFLGTLGQVGQAQSHIENKKIGIGDIFIFFGVFLSGNINDKNELVIRKNNLKHIIFGYLQIGEIIYPNKLSLIEREKFEKKYSWLKKQPHWTRYKDEPNNCIYIARKTCTFDHSIKGFGVFNYNKKLVLTRENDSAVTHWNLPRELINLEISYHNKNSYKSGYFQSASRGQEFIIEENKRAEFWAKKLIKKYAKG